MTLTIPALFQKVRDNILNTSATSSSGNESDKSMIAGYSWKDIGFFLFSIGMVIGPHIGYMFQIHEMSTKRNVEGYSPVVSAILLLSNSIRILYYFGYHFALALLFQSILAVVVHLLLLLLVVHIVHSAYQDNELPEMNGVEMPEMGTTTNGTNHRDSTVITSPPVDHNNNNNNNSNNNNNINNNDNDNTVIVEERDSRCFAFIWLDRQASRIEFAILSLSPTGLVRAYFIWLFIATMTIFLYYAIIREAVVIGYIALGLEALLVLPQILRNHRRRSTTGLTMMLVLTWVLGDVIKVIYFILDKQPFPFLFCGCVQIALDVVVVAQVVYYRCRNRREVNRENEVAVGDISSMEEVITASTRVVNTTTPSGVMEGEDMMKK